MRNIVKDKLPFVAVGLILTFASLQAPIWWAEREIRIERIEVELEAKRIREERRTYNAALGALSFEDILYYHKIIPPKKTVLTKSRVRWVSDSEVTSIIEKIEGGVLVFWFDSLMCGPPKDEGVVVYNLYEAALPTSFRYLKVKKRLTPEKLADSAGYLIRISKPIGYTGEKAPPMLFPDEPSNCILRSLMEMEFPNGMIRSFEMRSEPVFVRDELPE